MHTDIRQKAMKQSRLKDNSSISAQELEQIPVLKNRICNKTLEQLEREGVFVFPELIADAEDVTRDQFILKSNGENYRTQNVMGFIGCGQERLVITSRFSGGEHDYFLQYMLEQVLDFPNVVDLETDANHDDRLFYMLLFLFPSYLKQAIRKGMFKTYIRKEYNDSNIKGTIDIARHIRKNTPFVGKVAYSQREHSYDNYLTELVRHTIEYIKRKPYGRKILFKVKDEVRLVVEATQSYVHHDRVRIIEENMTNAVRHAYYREYRALQRLCLLILREQKHQIGSGARQIYGILFDGAWLWEEYVNKLICDKFYHPRNKSGDGAQYLFKGGIGRIYPDFISRSISSRIIADAKYKLLDSIHGRDYLQVLAYMFRFDAKTGYYLYPDSKESGNKELLLNQGSSYEQNVSARNDVRIIKQGLKIPSIDEYYSDFVKQMKENEEMFLCRFTEHMTETIE